MQVLLCGGMPARGRFAGCVRGRGAAAARLVRIAARAVAAGGRAEERGRSDVRQGSRFNVDTLLIHLY